MRTLRRASSERSSVLSRGRRHQRSPTKIDIEWSALLMRREAAKALAKRYDAGERLDKARGRRGPLVPPLKRSRRLHAPSESTPAKKAGPSPYSNMWRVVWEIQMSQVVTRNPPLPIESARFPLGPVAGLNEIFPPTIAETTFKGTPIDRGRRSEWANNLGPHPRMLARFESYQGVLQSFRNLSDSASLKDTVSKRFSEALLMARHIVATHDLAAPYIAPWSRVEEIKFPLLILGCNGNFKHIAVQLPNKTTAQVMVYFKDHCQELAKMDIVRHITQYLQTL
ncbi:hypothetical protein B0H13DRAFT_2135722 [Mycena leptocephala]|nr:hypothetical protein B0H13DRAFT_2135722 [Mycena leptocephala]